MRQTMIRPLLRRRLLHALPAAQLPHDVCAATGLCADGRVRIASCEPSSKGLGAFAAKSLQPGEAIGEYVGEVLTLGELLYVCVTGHTHVLLRIGLRRLPTDALRATVWRSGRYGDAGGCDGAPTEYEAANAQAAWAAERASRGVGVSGQYIFNAGSCPTTRRALLLDAEDPRHANWTRFLNHSVLRANLEVERPEADAGAAAAAAVGVPRVRFVVARPIAAGEELLFDCASRARARTRCARARMGRGCAHRPRSPDRRPSVVRAVADRTDRALDGCWRSIRAVRLLRARVCRWRGR